MKTALFSGMFKAFPVEEAISKAAEVGYDGFEMMVGFGADHLDADCTPERASELGRHARDCGIDLCLIYTRLGGGILSGEAAQKEDLEAVKRFLEIGDRMSCKMLKVTAGRLRDHAYSEEGARVVAGWLGQACDLARAHGARVVAEIHFGQYCETVQMAREMIDLVDRPNFGVIHDAGNLHITGDMYGADSVEVLGDRVFHVHIKDMVRTAPEDAAGHEYAAGRFKRALLNDGDVDHLPLFRALEAGGFDGYLSCEASGGEDPVAVAKHELEAVRALLARV